MKKLNSAYTFDAKTRFINNKIEYDQRFFNHGYSEEQQFVSDIRKQLRVNKEIYKFRDKARNVCDNI